MRLFHNIDPILLGLIRTAFAQAISSGSQYAFEDRFYASHTHGSILADEDIWPSITPTTDLTWYGCYSATRECARLLVPLDYSQKNGTQASIALVRVPSAYPPDSPDYRGPILVNPGGPGGSGVAFALGATGDALSSIVGPQFDIVGFDPRGIARSRPKAEIFETSAERVQWFGSAPLLDGSDESIARIWAQAKIAGDLIEERAADYFELINTDYTARDMLQIVKAHGRDKLQYYGISYGSLLGSTFAALFPNRVERLVIDGVIDAEEWFSTTNPMQHSLSDAGKVLQSFYDGCYAAGPQGCPFYASDPKFIAQNLTAIANSLRKVPIPVKTNISYGLVDWDLLHSTVFSALYQPYTTFYPLAQSLAELAKGNAKPFYQLSETPGFSCDCSTGTDFSYPTQESGSFVICSDGGPLPRGLKFAKFYYHEMDTIAPWGGGIMSLNFLDCTGWPKFRRTNFQGPFSATTNFPILLIGNTADPVTPLRSARKMSAGFKNSVLLRQDSAGHTSLSSPSSCTLQMIQDYFVNGLLPDENTVCAIDGSPWPNLDEEILAAKKSLSPKREELLRISRKLSRVFKVPRLA